MPDDVSVRVRGLGKRYALGGPRGQYQTFRDAIVSSVQAPARILSRRGADRSNHEFWALRDVSFDVKSGEVIGIIGRNGAGKSTLLKILSRITTPTEGCAQIHGRVGSLLEIGTGFHPEMTGRENIFFNGSILGMKKAEIGEKFDGIVQFSEIDRFIDTPVKRYSSGMYVRLAFAVAAHLEPEILLVDEVLAVGDAGFQKKCLGKMGDVAQEGRTVLFVSHNMAAVQQLCSRAILLSNGRLEKTGGVREVISHYLSESAQARSGTDAVLAKNPSGSLALQSIDISGGTTGASTVAQCGQDLSLVFSVYSENRIGDIALSVGINDNFASRISLLHSTISGQDLCVDKGLNRFVCRIPHLALLPGVYILDFKIISLNEALLWAPGVYELIVESGDFFNTGRLPDSTWAGVVLLDQHWEQLREARPFPPHGTTDQP